MGGRLPLPRRHTRLEVTAALLNLSGLSLGYWYLRQPRIGLAHLAGTGVLLLVVCVAGAASRAPRVWLAIAALWLCWTAVHAWSLASRAPSDARRPPWAMVAAAAMVPVALVAGLAGLRAAAAGELDEGVAAHETGDCETAQSHYGRLVTLYGLSFSEASATGLERQRQCVLLTDARDAATGGDFEASIAAYEEYLDDGDALAVGTVRGELARARLNYAGTLWGEIFSSAYVSGYAEAIEQYGIVLTDFPGYEADELADEVLAEYRAGREAVSELLQCESLKPLRYFVSAPDLPSVQESGALKLAETVAAEAASDLSGLLFDCGEEAYYHDDVETAEMLLQELVDDFPDTTEAAAAQSILDRIEEDAEADAEAEEAEEEAAAEQAILDAIADARDYGGDLSEPNPSGSTGDGSVVLEIGNASHLQIEVLYTGPETGSITISGCSDCASQCSDWVAVWETLTLPAGEYEMVVRTTSGNVIPYYGVWGLDSGTSYQDCYYIE